MAKISQAFDFLRSEKPLKAFEIANDAVVLRNSARVGRTRLQSAA